MLRRNPDLDIVRVQDVGLSNVDDATILEWAAQEGRILHEADWMVSHVVVSYDWERAARVAKQNGRADWAVWLRYGRAEQSR